MPNLPLLKCAWCCLGFGAACLMAESYPTVAPLRQTFVVADIGQANVAFDIKSPEGTVLYRLQCHSAGYTGDPDFEYSGDLECRLSMIGHSDAYSTLLTENPHQSRDWESRGRFFAADLSGSCARIPQFGTNRTFRLRGMELALQVANPVFATSGKLSSLKLTVNVHPDPSAKSPIAETIPMPKSGVPAKCKLEAYFPNPSTL